MALTDRTVQIALSPAKGADQLAALTLIAKATKAQREKVCPAGYRGRARRQFISQGVVQSHIIRSTPNLTQSSSANNKEATMASKTRTNKSNAKSTSRTRKGKAAPTARNAKRQTEAPKASGLSAAQVAKDNELDARKFRAFLRSAGIDRTFANKTAANKAVRAFRKAQ
jgi:hypothetical protein